MNNKYTIGGVLLASVLLGWLVWYFSDTQVIKRQLTELSWNISKKGKESTMNTALKMREVQGGLADKCLLVIPERSHSEYLEKELAIRYLLYYRNQFEMIYVVFDSMEIDFPAAKEARVQSIVVLQKKKKGKEVVEISASTKIGLKKRDGKWLLYQAEIAEALISQQD